MPPVWSTPHTAVEQHYYDPRIYTTPLPHLTLTCSTLQNDLPPYGNWSHANISWTNSVASSSSARSLPTILLPGVRLSWTPHGLGGSLTPPMLPSPPLISEKNYNYAAAPFNTLHLPLICSMPNEAPRGGVVSLPCQHTVIIRSNWVLCERYNFTNFCITYSARAM